MPALPSELPEWLRLARGGSEEHVGMLLEAYRGYLARIARESFTPRLQAKSGVSDLVQEAMLEAVRGFGAFRGTSEPELRAWLRQMLLYRVANVVRRYEGTRKRAGGEVPLDTRETDDPKRALPDDISTPSHQAAAREQQALVRRMLDRLPEDYRTVLVLRQQELLPFDEIGRRMNRTGHAARLLWVRALRRLREEMGGADG